MLSCIWIYAIRTLNLEIMKDLGKFISKFILTIKRNKKMTQEEFVSIMRKTRCFTDDAIACQKEIGIGTFLIGWEKYKDIIFKGYTEECLNSVSFRDYVWHMMCITKKLLKKETKEVPMAPSNVISFVDYGKKRSQN